MSFAEIDRSKYTPMMQQYLDIKKDYVDTLVFFRLGDFYEMFFDDAETASRELEIALTGRDAGADERVPMCGVPYHAVSSYIERLISKGFKVAIVEQVEDPALAKGIVKRDVVRLITPGTVIDDGSIKENENNYLLSVTDASKSFILVFTDFSTGKNYLMEIAHDEDLLTNEILDLKAKEIIVASNFNKRYLNLLMNTHQIVVSYNDETTIPSNFDWLVSSIASDIYKDAFCRLLSYISKTQKRNLTHFQQLEIYDSKKYLQMSIHTKRNLELTETLRNNQRKGSLLWVLDHCTTAMGSREMKKWLDKPLVDIGQIEKRLDIVEIFINNYLAREELKNCLKSVYDLERIVGRISYGNANAKDLAQLRRSLENIPMAKRLLAEIDNPLMTSMADEIQLLPELYDLLCRGIVDNPPLTIKDGDIIRKGYSKELDDLHDAASNGKKWILSFEANEREKTGIKNLKVGYNRIFGYYIEVSKSNLGFLPEDSDYIRKQTVASGERFITPQLKEMETTILGAAEKSVSLEYELFIAIRDEVSRYGKRLQELAQVISKIDCFISLAQVSEKNKYVKPRCSRDRKVCIVNGRHPVIELVMDKTFVANDIQINQYNTLLITGPNMSGKSTYMRQLAVMAILTQMGCFVPAQSCTIAVYDQIFTRIGASDDLVSGQSTFMVEMMEANNAIQNATVNSLILFDEIGRGTATYDGMSLAQAIIEYVHEKIGCTTLFSTHYHELIVLENSLKRLKNVHVTAKEEKTGIVFLHKVVDGPTDKSFGINVAELAKLPRVLIERSKELLASYESMIDQEKIRTDLFNFDDYETITPQDYEWLKKEIDLIDINSLTPLDALVVIANLKQKLAEEK